MKTEITKELLDSIIYDIYNHQNFEDNVDGAEFVKLPYELNNKVIARAFNTKGRLVDQSNFHNRYFECDNILNIKYNYPVIHNGYHNNDITDIDPLNVDYHFYNIGNTINEKLKNDIVNWKDVIDAEQNILRSYSGHEKTILQQFVGIGAFELYISKNCFEGKLITWDCKYIEIPTLVLLQVLKKHSIDVYDYIM